MQAVKNENTHFPREEARVLVDPFAIDPAAPAPAPVLAPEPALEPRMLVKAGPTMLMPSAFSSLVIPIPEVDSRDAQVRRF